MAPPSQAGKETPAGDAGRERSDVSGRTHGRRRAVLMPPAGSFMAISGQFLVAAVNLLTRMTQSSGRLSLLVGPMP